MLSAKKLPKEREVSISEKIRKGDIQRDACLKLFEGKPQVYSYWIRSLILATKTVLESQLIPSENFSLGHCLSGNRDVIWSVASGQILGHLSRYLTTE